MKLKEFLQKHLKNRIQAGPKSDIVLSSRVRLARNVTSKLFPWRANSVVLQEIWDKAKAVIHKQAGFKTGESFYLPDITSIDKQLLIERHLISYLHATSDWPRGVILNDEGRISVMVNEEDHFRIAAILPGFALKDAAKLVDEVDTKLNKDMGFAFSENWGFLTSCPTNAGTGLRASCLLHLAGLALTEKMEPMFAELSKLGIVVRGFYGEGTRVIGDIYQITNGTTLGKTESEILQSIEHVITGIISYENAARHELIEGKARILTEDRIFRAIALLKGARSIDFHETMSMLSKVRLGISIGLDIPYKEELLNELMIITQPAHLQELMGKVLNQEERDIIRAKIVREKLVS